MNQITNLPVETPYDYHLDYHITLHWRRLYQIHNLHQITLPVEIPRFSLSQTQPQCSKNTFKRFKWPLLLTVPAFFMHMNPHSSNWSHWRLFSIMLLIPIPHTSVIWINTLYNLMHNCLITSRDSLRTTPCTHFLCYISHPIPPVLQHSSHLTFHHRGLTQFQLLPTVNLQVTFPKPCHLCFL